MDKMERKIKHLEFIQSNIARMNQCSFQMKGWMLTIVAALLALYASSVDPATSTGNKLYILIAVFPTIVFWILDSYYLQQERKFRSIYNRISSDLTADIIKEFAIPLEDCHGKKYSLVFVMFSITEWLLYIPVIVGLIVGFIVIG